MSSEVAFDSREIHILLEPLLKDKSTGIASYSSQAWQEITNVISLFRQFGAKEQVCVSMDVLYREDTIRPCVLSEYQKSTMVGECIMKH